MVLIFATTFSLCLTESSLRCCYLGGSFSSGAALDDDKLMFKYFCVLTRCVKVDALIKFLLIACAGSTLVADLSVGLLSFIMPTLFLAIESQVWSDVMSEAHVGEPCILVGTSWCTDEGRALVVAYHAKARELGCALSNFSDQRPVKKEEMKNECDQLFKATTNEHWASHVAHQQGWRSRTGIFCLAEFCIFDVASWAGVGFAEVEMQKASRLQLRPIVHQHS